MGKSIPGGGNSVCKGLEVDGWWGRNRREQRGMRALRSPLFTPARAHSCPRPPPPQLTPKFTHRHVHARGHDTCTRL